MSDSYREIMVKRHTPPADVAKKIGLIGGTVLFFATGILVNPLLLLGGLAMTVACYFLLPGLDLEYEYLYVNGELDVDKIMAKQKRKKCATYRVEQMELLAPAGSHALDGYRGRKDIRVRDFTSLEPNVPCWVMVMNQEEKEELVKLELDSETVAQIRRLAPRKVAQSFSD